MRGPCGDVNAADLGTAVWREGLSALVDEESAGAVRRDDAPTAEGVGDEPDEPHGGEHPPSPRPSRTF